MFLFDLTSRDGQALFLNLNEVVTNCISFFKVLFTFKAKNLYFLEFLKYLFSVDLQNPTKATRLEITVANLFMSYERQVCFHLKET